MARRWAVLLLFFSGAAALVHQVVWSRLFKELFGVTEQAVAVVLAAYLGGLALGSWALGRTADRSKSPLALFGFLEIGIGSTALAGSFLIARFDPVHVWAASRLGADSAGLSAIRALLASVVILPPTCLMGVTLPAITRAVVGRLDLLGRDVGLLYAVNTAGAIAGSLAAGFVLIRWLGVHPTLFVAAGANLTVGAAALALGRRAAASPLERETPARAPAGLLVAIALSGVASLALEVIWTRTLLLIIGSSTHAFVTMVSVFLCGIALGGFIARASIHRLQDARRAFGWLQVGIAATVLASALAMGTFVGWAQRWLVSVEHHWLQSTLARFGTAFLALIVPTTLIGMTFPLAVQIGVRALRNSSAEIGRVYGANTAGNIAGALAGGFLVVPLFGLQKGVALVTLLNVASACWALFPAARSRPWRAAPALATAALCVALVVVYEPRPFATPEDGEGDSVLYYREGLVSTVKVLRRADDARQLAMVVDGVRIGQSNSGLDVKQQVLAHLPFVLRREVRNVLSVGLGTGILAGEVARHPGVERVECVEIAPPVIEAARVFSAFNGDVLENRAVHVVLDDGFNYLKGTTRTYDAVVSDGKSKLGQLQNALFYSEDYYRLVRSRLGSSGVMLQWMPLEEAPEDLRTIVRTFTAVFPHAALFVAQESCFLAGSESPIAVDLSPAQRILDAPETSDLARHGWRDAREVAGALVLDQSSARSWIGGEDTINSLEKPVLEFYPARVLALPSAVRVADNAAAISAAAGPRLSAPMRDLLAGLSQLGRGTTGQAIAHFQRAADASPEGGIVHHWVADIFGRLGLELDAAGQQEEALQLYRAALRSSPEAIAPRMNLAGALAAEGEVREAAGHFAEVLRLNPDHAGAHRQLAAILARSGNIGGAIAHLTEAVRLAPEEAQAHADLGELLGLSGQSSEALPHLREAMRLRPAWPRPLALAAVILSANPIVAERDPAEAIRLARRAADLTDSKDRGVLEILAAAYAAAGRFDEAVRTQLVANGLPGEADPQAEQTLDLYRRRLPRR